MSNNEARKFFTSDLHFGHSKICEYTDRQLVTTAEDHTDWLIDLWNSQVRAGDLVYHMGDFSFSDLKKTEKILDKLNGQKIFIKGNHDNRCDLIKLENLGKIQRWYDYKEIKLGKTKVCLFHFPIACWHKQHNGSWMLHGHSHGSFQGLGKSLDVGLDMSYNLFKEHKFFTEEMITEFMESREKVVLDGHKERKEG